ncbi:MAG: tRNA (N(6)-L-threonylcarbamoyladenosine(37)-C(2))-methylthiotransferase MtaB [Nitrospirae bacterium]|nr:tRNA (N(6)-L-threonylcarbamoyladenosine(37)-C(2))-methylthiotransferase MtaB [Nitrospirota bacterium]
MRIAIQTLGCKVNQSESASIGGILRDNGFEIVSHDDSPDVCIINTCTVTARSDAQSRQLIRKAARSGARVVAAGCYAQLRPDEISNIEGLDIIIGNSGKDNILDLIQKLKKDDGVIVNMTDPDVSHVPGPYYSSRSRAFLKIQDGCNFSCSYCAVPLARGRSRSVDKEQIVSSARRFVSEGYREIVLTGIHIGTYGLDHVPKSSLLNIVDMLAGSFPEVRIRLSSLEPQEFREEYLELIKNGPVCDHLHIPVQSCSDKILRAMNRGYTAAYFKGLIEKIVSACPGISVGTDLIAGFPGENDDDFYDTVRLIEQLPLSYLHVFPYSKRPDTKALSFEDHVSEKVKRERVKILFEIAGIKKRNYMKNSLDNILDVIVENRTESNGYWSGLSSNYLKLSIISDVAQRGQRIRARVISLTDTGLQAEHLLQ